MPDSKFTSLSRYCFFRPRIKHEPSLHPSKPDSCSLYSGLSDRLVFFILLQPLVEPQSNYETETSLSTFPIISNQS